MKRRSFIRYAIGVVAAVSTAGRLALQPELKCVTNVPQFKPSAEFVEHFYDELFFRKMSEAFEGVLNQETCTLDLSKPNQ